MKPCANEFANPLHEKLYFRFSYSGKTVAEMMRSRAEAEAEKIKKDEVLDTTAEFCITRANSLPREHGDFGTKAIPKARTALCRVHPCSVLAFVLFLMICSYLLFAGIGRHTAEPSSDFLASHTAEVELYEPTLDTIPSL